MHTKDSFPSEPNMPKQEEKTKHLLKLITDGTECKYFYMALLNAICFICLKSTVGDRWQISKMTSINN